MTPTGIYRLFVITICALKAVVLAGRFSGTPQDIDVVESNDALFICTVQSLNDSEHINFTKDGVLIKLEEQPWGRFKVEHIDALIIKLNISTVMRSDHGEYSCQIRTNTGDVVETSASGMLTVLEIPGENFPTCSSSKVYYVVGDTVDLKCTSEKTNPLPEMHWGLDPDIKNHNLGNSTNNGTFSEHYYFVAKQSDKGKSFTCTLNTPVDATVNRVCHFGPLSIQYAPKVTIISQEYYTGQEIVLICSAEGNPYPTSFSWSLSHTLDESQYKIENNDQILRLQNLKLEDNNLKVECTATNTVGHGSAEFTVTFKSQQTTSSSFEGDSVKADGNTSKNNSNVASGSLVVILLIIFICLLFVALVLMIPICIIKLQKSCSDMNPSQRELPPLPTSSYCNQMTQTPSNPKDDGYEHTINLQQNQMSSNPIHHTTEMAISRICVNRDDDDYLIIDEDENDVEVSAGVEWKVMQTYCDLQTHMTCSVTNQTQADGLSHPVYVNDKINKSKKFTTKVKKSKIHDDIELCITHSKNSASSAAEDHTYESTI